MAVTIISWKDLIVDSAHFRVLLGDLTSDPDKDNLPGAVLGRGVVGPWRILEWPDHTIFRKDSSDDVLDTWYQGIDWTGFWELTRPVVYVGGRQLICVGEEHGATVYALSKGRQEILHFLDMRPSEIESLQKTLHSECSEELEVRMADAVLNGAEAKLSDSLRKTMEAVLEGFQEKSIPTSSSLAPINSYRFTEGYWLRFYVVEP